MERTSRPIPFRPVKASWLTQFMHVSDGARFEKKNPSPTLLAQKEAFSVGPATRGVEDQMQVLALSCC